MKALPISFPIRRPTLHDLLPRIVLSYAQESDSHAAWVSVLALANRLRNEGVDAWIDWYEQFPPDGWRRWMTGQRAAA